MNEIEKNLQSLIHHICDLKFQEALDELYDDSVVTCENEEPPIVGLDAYKEAGKQFQRDVSNYSAHLKAILISGNISVCEWHYQFDHAKWGHWDKSQISVQRWKDGKIVHERHHY